MVHAGICPELSSSSAGYSDHWSDNRYSQTLKKVDKGTKKLSMPEERK